MASVLLPLRNRRGKPPANPRVLNPPVPCLPSLKQELKSSSKQLAETKGSQNIKVEEFFRYFVNTQGGGKKRRGKPLFSGSGDGAILLRTFPESFRMDTRGGRSASLPFAPHPEQPSPNASLSVRSFEAYRASRDRAMLPRVTNQRLLDECLRVRVTEFCRQGNSVTFKFLLKRCEDKVRRLQIQLNENGLGGPITCSPGLICAAPYPEQDPELGSDETYARVVVARHRKKGTEDVLVRYLDLGGNEFVKKTSLRELKGEFLKTPAFAYGAVVKNSSINPSYHASQTMDMLRSDETLIRVLGFDEQRKTYEVYVFSPADGTDYRDAGFLAG